jgi:hypothetical protein
MQLTYVAVVVLASMIFVLSGMVGYVYWQQTRMLQNLQSLAVVISTHLIRPPQPQPEESEHESEMPLLVPVVEEKKLETVHEDDRVSVNEPELVEGPPATVEVLVVPVVPVVPTEAPVDFEKKTASELKDILTSKNIPFGKRDAKSVLVQLLKATA